MTIKNNPLDSFGKPILIASIAGIAGVFFQILISPQDYFYTKGENCQQLEAKTNVPEVTSNGRTECVSWAWKYRGAPAVFSGLSSSFLSSALTIIFFEIFLRKFYAEQLNKSINGLLNKKRGEDSINQISKFYSTADKYHQEIWSSIEIKYENPSDKVAKIDAIEIHHSVYLLATDKLEILQKRVKNGWKIRLILTHFDQSTKDSVEKLKRIMKEDLEDLTEDDKKNSTKGYLEIRHYQDIPSLPFFYFNYSDGTTGESVVHKSILFSLFYADENYSVTPGFSVTDPSMKQQFDTCFNNLWDKSKGNKTVLSFKD